MKKQTYNSPNSEAIELKYGGVLCESPGSGGNEGPTPGSGF